MTDTSTIDEGGTDGTAEGPVGTDGTLPAGVAAEGDVPAPDTLPVGGSPAAGTTGSAAPASGSPARRLLWIAVAAAGVVALGLLLYACSVHTIPGDSDGATVILEGQAYNQGNFLLHHWGLSLDSFWAVDAVMYGLMVLVVGVRPGLLYAGPAIIATAVIVVGVLMAVEGRRRGAAIAGAVTVVAILGLPTHALAYFFLRGPLHVGTALWALVAFGALRRGRFGIGWVVAVIFLAAGMLGDLQAVAYAIIPMAVAGLLAMARERNWRAGIAQLSAAAAGVVVDVVVKKVRTALGGFSIGATNPTASHHQLLTNVKHVVTYGAEFFGIRNTLFPAVGVPRWLQEFHVVGALLLIACVLAGLVLLVRGLIGGPQAAATTEVDVDPVAKAGKRRSHAKTARVVQLWRLDDMLLVATFGPAGAFCVLAVTSDVQYTRYLTASVIFATILAGRMVARVWPRLTFGALAKSVAAVGAASVLLYGASVGYMLAQAGPGQPDGQLVSYLEAHRLYNGVTDYWTSNLTTVQSQGRVKLRPVVANSGTMKRYTKQSSSAWYAGQKFQFFVWNTGIYWGNINIPSAVRTWGKPATETKVGQYWILTWSHPLIVNPNPPVSTQT
ncbi:MAG TPA: hypothetical protein VGP46_08035 [Acidimicrobiales bacterium]|nr:hypothetical protein [Acidimicrobiales bacterium]